jgi:hypothetical protein
VNLAEPANSSRSSCHSSVEAKPSRRGPLVGIGLDPDGRKEKPFSIPAPYRISRHAQISVQSISETAAPAGFGGDQQRSAAS